MNSSQVLSSVPGVVDAPGSQFPTGLIARRKAFRVLHEGDVLSFRIRGMWVPRAIFNTWDSRLSQRLALALRSRRGFPIPAMISLPVANGVLRIFPRSRLPSIFR